MRKAFGVICGISAIAIVLSTGVPSSKKKDRDPKPSKDVVHAAFVTYERLWRKLAVEAAQRLDDGELKEDKQVWEFLAAGQEPIRRIAFEEVAKKEQEALADGWSAETHSKILRSYSGE